MVFHSLGAEFKKVPSPVFFICFSTSKRNPQWNLRLTVDKHKTTRDLQRRLVLSHLKLYVQSKVLQRWVLMIHGASVLQNAVCCVKIVYHSTPTRMICSFFFSFDQTSTMLSILQPLNIFLRQAEEHVTKGACLT